MKVHQLKILPEHYREVMRGAKKAEIRRNDRNYQVGDVLVLKEFDGEDFTGRREIARISHVLCLNAMIKTPELWVSLSLESILPYQVPACDYPEIFGKVECP